MNDETERLKRLIESHLAGALPGENAEEACALFQAMRYTLETPGKRVRPVLLLLSCKAVNGNENDALPYACAIELIHNYSLIHDDLPSMDDDDTRRGKPTNHMVFGEAMAILAGDGLLSAAFELMHADYIGHLGSGESLARRIRAGASIAGAIGTGGMVAGQAADIEAEAAAASAQTLDFIHQNKTAALIRAAARTGAYIGGASEQALGALTEYGECLGLAFQIADDILDFGTEEGKASYPALHGLERSRNHLEELTERAVRAAESADGSDPVYISILTEMARKLASRAE